MNKSDYFYLGFIHKTHGVKGEVIIGLADEISKKISKLESVFLEINNNLVPFFIEKISITHSSAIIKFEDVETIEEAQKLIKNKIFLLSEFFPKLSVNEFYDQQIIGFKIIDKQHGELGLLNEILNLPQQKIIQTIYKNQEILFPLNNFTVLKINRQKKIIYVNIPKGLLDIYVNIVS